MLMINSVDDYTINVQYAVYVAINKHLSTLIYIYVLPFYFRISLHYFEL